MNIKDQTIALWHRNETQYINEIEGWIANAKLRKANLAANEQHLSAFKKSALSLYCALGGDYDLDVRFRGQSIGRINFNGSVPNLEITPQKASQNKKYFKISGEGDSNLDSTRVKKILNAFKRCDYLPHVKEHFFETRIIHEMNQNDSDKLGGHFPKGIRPVTLANYPLQVPLPISAHKGYPEDSKGNIDILARTKVLGTGNHLSVWELKKPGATDHAAWQAYIYAITLLLILRSSVGQDWYNEICGYSGSVVPKTLHIDVVACVEEKQRSEIVKQFRKIKDCKIFGQDKLHFKIVTYKEVLAYNKPIEL